MQPKLSPAGDRALLADVGDISAWQLHAAAIASRAVDGVLAAIVGQQSLYVVFNRTLRSDDEASVTDALSRAPDLQLQPRQHSIEVSFAAADAPDLSQLLRMHSIDRGAFLDRMRRIRLTARYLGFRAGFAYLDGWPQEWSMPRRPTSRLRVARGSFAVAAGSAGFYAVDSPGGWNILGRTAAPLWDARREPPNLIAAGDEVSIVPVEELTAQPAANQESIPPPAIRGVEILANSQFVTVVRPAEWSRIEQGLSPGGPFDESAATAANALVGADAGAPLFECAMAGPKLRFLAPRVIAWVGAESDLPRATPVSVNGGDEVDVGRIRGGLRGWLAIGDSVEPLGQGLLDEPSERFEIRVAAGPHQTALREIECEVTPQLNRVGIRMRPLQPIGFDPPAHLPSCGMQFGTIQLHPDGTLVAMGPDHPITGGYLQPMTVLWDERWKLAQLAPGDRVRFVS